MTLEGKAASVHDRLLAKTRASGGDFNLLLTRYALERFLYRISASRFQESFLLKGALLFSLWYDAPRRPTRDADLLGLEARDLEAMKAVFREICEIPCEDGMHFLSESVQAIEIREDARYGGIRIELVGMLGKARCPVQVDVGFGDAVTPEPTIARFPAILDDNPAPFLKAYPRETVLGEKFEAIVSLGMANSRMKDYFDLFVLIQDGFPDHSIAGLAMRRTFERRGTPIPVTVPIGLSDEFANDFTKRAQWKAFLSKNKLEAPPLIDVVGKLREFWIEVFDQCILVALDS